MLGEQFMVGEEICGAVISVRYQVNLTHIKKITSHVDIFAAICEFVIDICSLALCKVLNASVQTCLLQKE